MSSSEKQIIVNRRIEYKSTALGKSESNIGDGASIKFMYFQIRTHFDVIVTGIMPYNE